MPKDTSKEISLRVVEIPTPILHHTKWMEFSYPTDISQDQLVEELSRHLEMAEELAQRAGVNQIKIPVPPDWEKLESVGFSKGVYHMSTSPDQLSLLPEQEHEVLETKNLDNVSEIKPLIEKHFRYHSDYDPDYFTSDVEKRVNEFLKHAKTSLEKGTAFLLIAKKEGTIVGFTYGEYEDDYGCIDEMFVEEDLRNNGIGTQMLRFSAPHFEENPCTTVGAYVGVNAPALKFWEAKGFSKDFANWIRNIT